MIFIRVNKATKTHTQIPASEWAAKCLVNYLKLSNIIYLIKMKNV